MQIAVIGDPVVIYGLPEVVGTGEAVLTYKNSTQARTTKKSGWKPVVTRIVNLLPTSTRYWITKAARIATGNSAIHLSDFINPD